MISPETGAIPLFRVRSMVDLPAPLGPMIVVTSWGDNLRETSDTASLEPYLTEMLRASSIKPKPYRLLNK
jgi:hypothetical protein